MAIAVRSTGVAAAIFSGDELLTARVSASAAKQGYAKTKTVVAQWLQRYRPDHLVLEDHKTATRKAKRQRHALRHLPAFARRHPCSVSVIERKRQYENLYVEATALAKRFPILQDRVPRKPHIWESEPHFVPVFEAVALGVIAIDQGNQKRIR